MAEAPAKKMCLEKGKQGKKNMDLARMYESYGVPLRVRCKVCYQEWFQQGVQRLVEEGMYSPTCALMTLFAPLGMVQTEAVLKMQGQTPKDSEVPTYAKSGTESLKRHLVVKHNAVEANDSANVLGIDKVFPKAATVEDKVGLVFCMNPNLPLALVDDAFFQQAFGHPFSRCPPPHSRTAILLKLRHRRTFSVQKLRHRRSLCP